MATSSSSCSHHDNPQKVQFPLDSAAYKNLEKIGFGGKAVVYKAICFSRNSAIVAIKSVDLNQSTADFEGKLRGTKTFSLSHPNILSYHCAFTTADRRLWVQAPRHQDSVSFPPQHSQQPLLLHHRRAPSLGSHAGHAHGDIKPGNILVDSDGSIKLADFGVSASFYGADHSTGTNDTSATPTGTNDTSAMLDMVAPYGDGCKVDIWAFGIMALELARGCPPLSGLPPLLESQILKVKNRYRFSDYENIIKDFKNKEYSVAFKDLVGSCLDQDAAKRPAAETLLKHSFFDNCRGKDFLVETVLRRLESVEERFKKRNRGLGDLLGKEEYGGDQAKVGP
ncbi:unnamed protein product [Malus baccata var. baccata]